MAVLFGTKSGRGGAKADDRLAEVQDLQRAAALASDEKILEVLSFVERTPERGLSDEVIASVRPRIAALRPPRPLKFTRILFKPLEALIVPGPEWQPGCVGIPRNSLAALSAQVYAGLVAAGVVDIDRLLRMNGQDKTHGTLEIGRILWGGAAVILQAGPTPANWMTTTGLTASDHTELASACAGILSLAYHIESFAPTSGRVMEEVTALVERFVHANSVSPVSVGGLLVVLMTRLPKTHQAIIALCDKIIGPDGAILRRAYKAAANFILDRIERDNVTRFELAEAARKVAFGKAFLDTLRLPGSSFQTSRSSQRRVMDLHEALDTNTQARFSSELKTAIVSKACRLPKEAEDQHFIDLERAISSIRRLGGAGRRFGSPDYYDRLIEGAAREVGSLELPALNRSRLVALLRGEKTPARS